MATVQEIKEERNYHEAVTWDEAINKDDELDFLEVFQVEGVEQKELANTVQYISKWIELTKLKTLLPTTVKNAYKTKTYRGIFNQYMQNSFF